MTCVSMILIVSSLSSCRTVLRLRPGFLNPKLRYAQARRAARVPRPGCHRCWHRFRCVQLSSIKVIADYDVPSHQVRSIHLLLFHSWLQLASTRTVGGSSKRSSPSLIYQTVTCADSRASSSSQRLSAFGLCLAYLCLWQWSRYIDKQRWF